MSPTETSGVSAARSLVCGAALLSLVDGAAHLSWLVEQLSFFPWFVEQLSFPCDVEHLSFSRLVEQLSRSWLVNIDPFPPRRSPRPRLPNLPG